MTESSKPKRPTPSTRAAAAPAKSTRTPATRTAAAAKKTPTTPVKRRTSVPPTPAATRRQKVEDAVQAADVLVSRSAQDVLKAQAGTGPANVVETAKTLFDGLSPDEATQLRQHLLSSEAMPWRKRGELHADEELSCPLDGGKVSTLTAT